MLDSRAINAEVVASLAGVLQTVLDLAAAENNCGIPVFSIWGEYCGGKRGGDRVAAREGGDAAWIPAGMERDPLWEGERN